jgi:hypothetical protein
MAFSGTCVVEVKVVYHLPRFLKRYVVINVLKMGSYFEVIFLYSVK